MIRRIIYLIFGFLLFIGCFLMIRYIMNEQYVKQYEEGIYDNGIVNFLLVVNYPEPYVAHYNKGNNLFHNYDYDGAIEEYEKALVTTPKDLRCVVLNNEAQAMARRLQPTNPFYATEIEYIQKILEKEGCAEPDGSGLNENSQEIYDELEDEKDKAEGGQGEGGEDPIEGFNPDDYQDVEDDLKEQQGQAEDERDDGKGDGNSDGNNGREKPQENNW